MSEGTKSTIASWIGPALTVIGFAVTALLWVGKAPSREEMNHVKSDITEIRVKQAEQAGEAKSINVKIDWLLDRKADKNANKKARD